MPRSSFLHALTLCGAATALLAARPALAGDVIVQTDGRPLGMPSLSGSTPTAEDFARSRFTVEEKNLDKVMYKIEGVPQQQSVDASKVRRVYHDPDNVPPSLTQGRALLDAGRTEEAREAFASVAGADVLPWARQEAAFLVADSYYYEGDFEKAIAELGAFKRQFPNSTWIMDATSHRALASLELGKAAEATAEFKALRDLKGIAPELQLEADYRIVWIQEQLSRQARDNKALDAVIRDYEALLSRVTGRPGLEPLGRRIQVGKASAMLAQGKVAEARQILDKLQADTPGTDRTALAAIHTLLGNAVLRGSPGSEQAYQQALRHFLRVVVLYGDAPGAEPYLAESMYQAGQMFSDLTAKMQDEERRRDYKSRARREWQELVQRFPRSPWAQQAQQALNR